MAIIKCKMCGGDLNLVEGASTAQCEYCGSVQTVPKVDDEKKLTLFARANRLRVACDFDKAAGIYEAIVADFPDEAEAYWGLVLCKYGIEYVDDPATGKKIPTCHRSSFTSILDDSDFEQAMENSAPAAQKLYREEAKQFERIRKGILEVSSTEKPYDIFICYKETAENGDRTLDSVLAQDLYGALTDKGYRVFFSRITLQGKLGEAYEPYIFAALNSAKVMLAVGTCYEYYNAVWVKNEWSRYIKLCQADKTRHLIPCYKNLDPEDMPKEFNHLQGADLGKMGAVQDILFNMEKYIPLKKGTTTVIQEKVVVGGNASTAPLLKRAFMFLEDGDWGSANEYCEKVLDIDPENAQAYLGKLMAELKVKKQEDLKNQAEPFDSKNNYQKVLRFADEKLKTTLTGYINHIRLRNEETARYELYSKARNLMKLNSISGYEEASILFQKLPGYRDADVLVAQCQENERDARKDLQYTQACGVLSDTHQWAGKKADIKTYEDAIEKFRSLDGWRDSEDKILLCRQKIKQIQEQLEQERQLQEQAKLDAQQKAELARKEAQRIAKRNKTIGIIVAAAIAVIIAAVILVTQVIIPNNQYNAAQELQAAGKYAEAAMVFGSIPDYRDSREQSFALWNEIAVRDTIAAGGSHTVGLKADGTAVAVGNNGFGQCNVFSWKNIVAISTGYVHTVGLKADGTVVSVGGTGNNQRDVSSWRDIVAISAGHYHTVGLKADGTVVAVGANKYGQCDVSSWKNIVAISAGDYHTVGLKADGTVVTVGDNYYGQCDVSSWKDIVAISAGHYHTVGLKADGTVVAVGANKYGQCDVSSWKDIVAISTGYYHTVGLRADGSVVAVGDNDDGQCNVSSWKDIVAISTGYYHTVGLRADGSAVAVGDNDDSQCDVSDWKNIKTN